MTPTAFRMKEANRIRRELQDGSTEFEYRQRAIKVVEFFENSGHVRIHHNGSDISGRSLLLALELLDNSII